MEQAEGEDNLKAGLNTTTEQGEDQLKVVSASLRNALEDIEVLESKLTARDMQLKDALCKICLYKQLLEEKDLEIRQLNEMLVLKDREIKEVSEHSSNYDQAKQGEAIAALLAKELGQFSHSLQAGDLVRQNFQEVSRCLEQNFSQRAERLVEQFRAAQDCSPRLDEQEFAELQVKVREQARTIQVIKGGSREKQAEMALIKAKIQQLQSLLSSEREQKLNWEFSLGSVAELAIAKLKTTILKLQGQKQDLEAQLEKQVQANRQLRKEQELESGCQLLYKQLREHKASQSPGYEAVLQELLGETPRREELGKDRKSARRGKQSYHSIMSKRSPQKVYT